MRTLFDEADRQSILDRLDRLPADAPRRWGRMSASQMLAHCSNALEVGTGDRPLPRRLIGRIFGPLVRSRLLGDPPFPRNSPTDPAFVIRDERSFEAERRRLTALVRRFADLGRANASRQVHSFLGPLTGDEWGIMMYKHIDHHLGQFGG